MDNAAKKIVWVRALRLPQGAEQTAVNVRVEDDDTSGEFVIDPLGDDGQPNLIEAEAVEALKNWARTCVGKQGLYDPRMGQLRVDIEPEEFAALRKLAGSQPQAG